MIISVAGAHSNVGKTTLITHILRAIKGLGTVKYTKTAFYTSIIDDIEILRQADKDTALMLEAGAEKVLWVQAPPNELEELAPLVIGQFDGLKAVIIEGNSPVEFFKPHLVIFLLSTPERIKSSAIKLIEKADVIVVPGKGFDACKRPGVKVGVKVFVIDTVTGKGELDRLIGFIKEKIDECED